MNAKFSRSGFVRSHVVPALLLFAIPVAGYAFARHAQQTFDARFLDNVSAALDSSDLPAEKRAALRQFYRDNPASALCAAGDQARGVLPAAYVSQVCGVHAQFGWIERVSAASIALGLLSVVFVLACVGISFASRELQYWSFLVGWNFLRIASTLQVLAQGLLAVMLSFWVTAFFFERYFVKLILLVGIAALGAAAMLIRAIFRKPDDALRVEGEPLAREQSPELWKRVEGLCAKLGTAPPQVIVGGIDDNFFVTEHPVHAGPRVFEGRSLFVSLSLLKRLRKSEADAVLAHEMAHFSGGDTLFSKKLSPLLARYLAYLEALYGGALSRPVFYFMWFYWSLFQIALGRQRRERELRADKLAAELTSPDSIGNALLKVAAYSCYRARVERGLFERNRAHSALDIAHAVAVGFVEYARGQNLNDDLRAEGAVPHPFDSHPALRERLRNVGVEVVGPAVVDRVVHTEAQTWWNEIGDAQRIETALWNAYQARFRDAHEEALAYRYLPANDAERTHVERFFPALTIGARSGEAHALHIDCQRLHYEGWSTAQRWEDITNVVVKPKAFRGKVLLVSVGGGAADSVEIPLRKLAGQEAEVLAVVGRYYARALAAKQYNTGRVAAPRSERPRMDGP